MTDTLTNFVDMTSENIAGNVANLAFDIDFKAVPFESGNEKAPKFKLVAKSPKGRDIEIGGIWERVSQENRKYFTLTINTGHSTFYATLGRYPGQDDPSLYAIIPNDYLNKSKD